MTVLSRDATAEPEEPDDAALIERSRAEDSAAYEELYERHAEPARRLARRLSRDRDRAEDLVAEAFTRVLSALRRGNGPDLAFRPYLLTVVRNIAIEWSNGDKRLLLVDGYEALERPTTEDDPVIAGVERGLAAQAFSELPERWQAVLWHTEVEGESPAGIAPLLGLSPNAVAALAVRAREGLREEYLRAHLSGDLPDSCRDHADGLARYTRGRLMRRKSAALQEHLDGCARCSALYAELVQANTGLGALIGVAVLGPLAAVYGLTGVSGVALSGSAGAWLARLRPRGSTGTAVAAGAAAVVVAVSAFAAVQLTSGDAPHREAAPVARGGANPGNNNGGNNPNNNGGKNGNNGNSGGKHPASSHKPAPHQNPPAANTPQSRPHTPKSSAPSSKAPSSKAPPSKSPPSKSPPKPSPTRPAPTPSPSTPTHRPTPSDPPSAPAPGPTLPTEPPQAPTPTCSWSDPSCWLPDSGVSPTLPGRSPS